MVSMRGNQRWLHTNVGCFLRLAWSIISRVLFAVHTQTVMVFKLLLLSVKLVPLYYMYDCAVRLNQLGYIHAGCDYKPV